MITSHYIKSSKLKTILTASSQKHCGKHNQQNVVCALTATLLGVAPGTQGLGSFPQDREAAQGVVGVHSPVVRGLELRVSTSCCHRTLGKK